MGEFYEPRSVKRKRSTNAQLAELDDVIVAVVTEQRPITLRGIFYQVVSRGTIEKNEAEYGKVSRQLRKLREAGRVPYHWIADGTRSTFQPRSWSNVADLFLSAAGEYRRDPWMDQLNRVYIVSEKDAITGVIEPTTRKWDVPLSICRGYSSLTFTHALAQSINVHPLAPTYVYQLGDHDPSGVDAWRDFQEKLHRFVSPMTALVCERLAVTPAQIEAYELPTRVTKKSDTRSAKFVGESVEVDALPASVIRDLITNAVESRIDHERWERSKAQEARDRTAIAEIIDSRIWESAEV